MNKAALLVFVMMIVGCDKIETAIGKKPIGRYQISTSSQPNGLNRTVILDTQEGEAWIFHDNDDLNYRFFPIGVIRLNEAKRLRDRDMVAELAVSRFTDAEYPLTTEELSAIHDARSRLLYEMHTHKDFKIQLAKYLYVRGEEIASIREQLEVYLKKRGAWDSVEIDVLLEQAVKERQAQADQVDKEKEAR